MFGLFNEVPKQRISLGQLGLHRTEVVTRLTGFRVELLDHLQFSAQVYKFGGRVRQGFAQLLVLSAQPLKLAGTGVGVEGDNLEFPWPEYRAPGHLIAG
ncbi:hypothetical protein D3C77_13600 [compost metagenome]